MVHTIFYNPETHIIEVKITGDLDNSDTDEIISAIVQTAMENNCFLCLADYRHAVLNLSTFQIFEVPEKISQAFAQFEIHPVKLKRAIVVANNLKDFYFYETATLNSGQNIKLFQDIDEAKKWLFTK